MTTNLPELQQPRAVLESQPARFGRSWLILGALAVVSGLAYGASRLAPPTGTPSPSPGKAVTAPVATQNASDEPDPAPTGAVRSPSSQTEKAVDGEEEADPGTPPSSETSDGAYFVRVASYKGDKDAAEYAATLSARGLPAQSSSDPSGAAWQLVRLGPFQNRGEAEKARFKLKLHEREKAYVVPRSNGKYHVQVGSFASLEEAGPVAKRFSTQGHATKISRIKMGDRRWHCVRIGPFDTAEEAADYQELVKEISNTESVVIPYGPPKE
jgi:cell division protein FtsN